MLRARRRIFKRWLAVFMVLLVSLASESRAYTTKVTTKFGRVYGFLRIADYGRQRLVAHYFGIPYAEPPVDELRFRVSLFRHLPSSNLDEILCFAWNFIEPSAGITRKFWNFESFRILKVLEF